MQYLIDLNFKLHAARIPKQTKGMQVVELDHLTYIDSGLSCDTFNIIHITNGIDLEFQTLEHALSHFRNKEMAYCIWINQHNLSEAVKQYFIQLGVQEQAQEVGMYLDLSDYTPLDVPQKNLIQVAKTTDLLSTYAQVIASHWTPKDQDVIAFYQQTASKYLESAPPIILLVYFLQGIPVATAELFPTDSSTMGFYGFATLEAYRGQGIGTALMRYALHYVKSRGYQEVVLQASQDSVRIYQKLGFKEHTIYYEFA